MTRQVLISVFVLLVSILVVYYSQILNSLLSVTSTPATCSLRAEMTSEQNLAPVICVAHGGGPMPLLNDPSHTEFIRSMRERVPRILGLTGSSQRPRAIVVVTAHWSTNQPHISSAAQHQLLYDYYGFPPETYQLQYPAPGSPGIAQEVKKAFDRQGLPLVLDEERPWDHGVFVPMLLIHPSADIPILQVSVLESEDPIQHIRMGQALYELRKQNVAILGSGFASMHNLGNLRYVGLGRTNTDGGDEAKEEWLTPEERKGHEIRAHVREWNQALIDAASHATVEERTKAFAGWRKFPHSYEVHPRHGGEHFLPLLVTVGAAGDEETKTFVDRFLGMDILTFYWGAAQNIE